MFQSEFKYFSMGASDICNSGTLLVLCYIQEYHNLLLLIVAKPVMDLLLTVGIYVGVQVKMHPF